MPKPITVTVGGRRFHSLTELALHYGLTAQAVCARYRNGARGDALIARGTLTRSKPLGEALCAVCGTPFEVRHPAQILCDLRCWTALNVPYQRFADWRPRRRNGSPHTG